ncbi:cupin domain-containing protein [Aureibacillus halotolerans]|uniref:Quercetin dioxygenase-like cupin family protein n=1 Tax=Aureibacillus halotolerans TaxID=1508390 RepID=A0A4R6U423_9BACI|nr:cupin domain-containing protein [Aureibacillus halotolerans]TDQ40831.1 quercetin dioxygenase-like cupin family protein [Aureibacillus halotolerans]
MNKVDPKDVTLHALPRTVGNAETGETVTFLKTTPETNGAYVQFTTHLDPNDGIPMHYHEAFSESFLGIDGELSLKVNGKVHILKAGDTFVVQPGERHTFWNHTSEFVNFTVEIRPADDFERFIRCGYGLKADRRTLPGKIPVPRNPLLWGFLFQWGGTYLPVIPIRMQKLFFGALAKLGKWLGADKTLEKYYVEPEDVVASTGDTA